MMVRKRERWLCAVFLLVALLFGAFEARYGRSDYSQDAVCYLTLTRALQHHQWRLAGNPIWSVGYPALIAAADALTNHTVMAEWKAIHVLNLIILCATYLSFLFFLASADEAEPSGGSAAGRQSRLALLAVSLSIFVAVELSINLVSRVSPDMLVVCFFLLTAGLLLRIRKRPTPRRALLLGLTLGCGYVAKGIFLPISYLAFAALVVLAWPAKRAAKHLALSLAAFLLLATPYAAWLSASLGRFTAGEAGSLNYAASVNHLQAIDWQGGPPPLGTPLHPVQLLPGRPLMYAFAEPFHVTYPPFYERFYFDDGFRTFFSPRYQFRAILRNGHQLALLFLWHPIVYAWLLILWLLSRGLPEKRASWLRELRGTWPALALAVAAIGLYLLVLVVPRYLPGFLIVVSVLPLLALRQTRAAIPARLCAAVVAIALLGLVADLGLSNRGAFRAAARGRTAANDPSWMLGTRLASYGLSPGDNVGVIIHVTGAYATWAYLGHLNIVAEVIEPGQSFDPQTNGYEEDFRDYPARETGPRVNFWQLPPGEQQTALDRFRQAGAAAVVSLAKPENIPVPPGWIPVQGTGAWLYRLSEPGNAPRAANPLRASTAGVRSKARAVFSPAAE